MKPVKFLVGMGVVAWIGMALAHAQILQERAYFAIDGNVYDVPFGGGGGSTLPGDAPGADLSAFDTTTGLGTITYSIGAGNGGNHFIAFFNDIDFDPIFNDESGAAHGSLAANQSWEIGDPYAGTTSPDGTGNPYLAPGIFDHFLAAALQNANSLTGLGVAGGDDVSMALAYDISLGAADMAEIVWNVSTTQPSGFYLQQTDPSGKTIYFSSSLFTGPLPTVATPTISPNGGNFNDSVQVTLACSTAGATIYYTLDRTDPTTSSMLYAAPFTLTSSATVQARAFASGYNPSVVGSANFTPTVQCATRDVAFWSSRVVTPPRSTVSCVTLSNLFNAMPGGLMNLGFLQVNLDGALGIFWGNPIGTGDVAEADDVCIARKALAKELIAAIGNVTLLNPDSSLCGVQHPQTGEFILIGTLIQQAQAATQAEPSILDCSTPSNQAAWTQEMNMLTALLNMFNGAGVSLPFPGALIDCGVGAANANYIAAHDVDPTTQSNCTCVQ